MSATQLPSGIIGSSDIKRLLRELRDYEDVVHQRSLVQGKGQKSKPHFHSTLLKQVAEELTLELDRSSDRDKLIRRLDKLQDSAPVINLYFAVEPSSRALQRISRWFRREIHPSILIDISVRPSIIGGCIVRSANKVFDYSLAAKMTDADESLGKQLKTLVQHI